MLIGIMAETISAVSENEKNGMQVEYAKSCFLAVQCGRSLRNSKIGQGLTIFFNLGFPIWLDKDQNIVTK